MSRILFGLIPAWGHAAPTVAIAQRLMAAGHTVAYAAHPSMRKLLDSAGLELLEEFQWGDNLVQGMELMRQVTGAAFFLLVAALIEGNLSPSELPNEAKYVLGVTGWVLVALILALGGRRRALPEDVVELRKAPGERGPSLRGLLSGGRRRTAERAAPLVTPNASGTTRSAP